MSKKIKEKLCKIIACLIATLCVLPVAGVAASTKHADLADKFVECTTTLNYTTATAYTRINRPNADKLTEVQHIDMCHTHLGRYRHQRRVQVLKLLQQSALILRLTAIL